MSIRNKTQEIVDLAHSMHKSACENDLEEVENVRCEIETKISDLEESVAQEGEVNFD